MPTAPPAPFGVPYTPRPGFVGRETELAWLEAALAPDQATAVVCGLGGLGKTQLAVEYAHAARDRFPGGVFWLTMDPPVGIAAQVAAYAGPGGIDLPEWDPDRAATNQAAVQWAWQEPLPRLLVFDGLEDPAILQEWRPPLGGCRVLITSRNRLWPARLGVRALRLDTLLRADSLALLLTPRAAALSTTLAGLLAAAPTAAAADALCAWCGDLPLALSRLAAHLAAHPDLPLATLLAELEAASYPLDHPALRPPVSLGAGEAPGASLSATFARSYDRLDETDPGDTLARTLLHRAAWCAPGVPIPDPCALRLAGLDPAAPGDPQADGAAQRLGRLGLLIQELDGSLVVHPLVAAYGRERAPGPAGDQAVVEQTLTAIVQAGNKAATPRAGAPYLAHLRLAATRLGAREDQSAVTLLTTLVELLVQRGEYGAARPLAERALAIREATSGPAHPDTAESLIALAGVVRTQGEYAAARALAERAVDITEQALGPNDPGTARSLTSLARGLTAQGEYAAARALHERALAIREQAFGSTHPDTARSLDHLADLLWLQGEYAAARPLYEQVLALDEEIHGPTHWDTAASLSSLAWLLHEQGEDAAARPLYERARPIFEQVCGPTHSATANCLNGLAGVFYQQKAYAEARRLYEQALAIYEEVYGPDHPTVAVVVDNLALVQRDEGEYETARVLAERALAIRERALGPAHPWTAWTLNRLADVLWAQGEIREALARAERGLAIREATLGSRHPYTARSLYMVGGLLWADGAGAAAARPLLERAVAIGEAVLGPQHWDTRRYRKRLEALQDG